MAFVRDSFPDLLPRYERAYTGTNISPNYQAAIELRLARIRERHGFLKDAMQSRRNEAGGALPIAVPPVARTGQLGLPL